jgi:hypothetical protein
MTGAESSYFLFKFADGLVKEPRVPPEMPLGIEPSDELTADTCVLLET